MCLASSSPKHKGYLSSSAFCLTHFNFHLCVGNDESLILRNKSYVRTILWLVMIIGKKLMNIRRQVFCITHACFMAVQCSYCSKKVGSNQLHRA